MARLTLVGLLVGSLGSVVGQASFQSFPVLPNRDTVFELGNVSYLATTSAPLLKLELHCSRLFSAATHVVANSTNITDSYLQDVVATYTKSDDVFSEHFLKNLIITSSVGSHLDKSAIEYIESIGSQLLYTSGLVESSKRAACGQQLQLPPGPLVIISNGVSSQISKVYRLYEDIYRDFVVGIHEANGIYRTFDLFGAEWGYPMVPVPSKLYSWNDPHPFAGKRFGVKDIYDIEGIQKTRGSRAYSAVYGPANATAPSIEKIIELGGVVVGKQKTAQFASAAPAWEWTDAYYPQNPRGDGYLSCSASSAGGGCSIAAYDWLDYAIGTDTGQSMRQPAAFSGTFGNRPSQGLMSLDHVMPIAYGVDTAGVFARDPHDWVKFAKAWYDPSLHQNSSLNGLPTLAVPDATTFPKRILYASDHLPLRNPAAEVILQEFLKNVSDAMGLSVASFNLTAAAENATGQALPDMLTDLNVLWTHDQMKDVAQPLLAKYAPHFPPLDLAFRSYFYNFTIDDAGYAQAMANRHRDSDAWHNNVLFSTSESCSESIIIYDIGTGGLPSFRETALNADPGAALPDDTGTVEAGSVMASYFGDADFTIPIGQVPYFSNVTHEEVMVPVTINMLVKRGCDFVLYNFIAELADKGILRAVQTGPNAFAS